MRIRTAAALALVAMLGGAPAAQAGEVELRFTGGYEYIPHGGRGAAQYNLSYRAAPGEANSLDARPVGDAFRVEDSSAPLTPGANCIADGAGVLCTPPGFARVVSHSFSFGDGNDSATLTNVRGSASLGDGDDALVRHDTDYPSEQNDLIVDPGRGADAVDAVGARAVQVTYKDRTAPLRVTLDGVADDGEAGEGDNIGPGVLTVEGGSAADTLVAGAGNAGFYGGPGDDRLTGGPARNHLAAGEGNDIIEAGAGPDTLYGGAGDDMMLGGEGDDSHHAEDGADVMRGEAGLDRLHYERSHYDERGVNVTLDDVANDGLPFEGDNAASDFEVVTGTQGPDRITGSAGADTLRGHGGQDVLDGASGPDVLQDSAGDTVIGGPGPDVFEQVTDGSTVVSRDGEQDRILCFGPMRASIDGDPFDPGEGCAPPPFMPLSNTRVKVDSRGRFTLTVRCKFAFTACAGPLRVAYTTYANRNPRTYVLARARFSTSGSRVQKIRLRLNTRWRRALRARRIWTVGAGVSVTRSLPQETATHSRSVKLLAPRRR